MSTASDLNLTLAARIRRARDTAILTQVELAAQLGVSLRSIQDWEAGKSIPQPARRRAVLAFIAEQEQAA